MKVTSRISNHNPPLKLILGGKSGQSLSRTREEEGTRLNLKYVAAIDRQARIRLANRLDNASRNEGAEG